MSAQTHFTTIRRILYGNAFFSGASGLLFALASTPIAKFIGIDDSPLVILVLGVGLAGYAALIYVNATRTEISRLFVFITVISDSVWVLLSILVLVTGWIPFSLEGKWAIGIVAVIVDVFATLQFIEWRKI